MAVVVAALDRFGRSILERIRSREELKRLGVPTHSVREGGEGVSDLVGKYPRQRRSRGEPSAGRAGGWRHATTWRRAVGSQPPATVGLRLAGGDRD